MRQRSERNIRLTLAYDGTDFFGWQVQKQGRTVQGVLEDALTRMHKHPVRVTAAGRTDSGVHASGQTVNFYSDLDSVSPQRFAEAVNSFLPKDIRIITSDQVPAGFHSRYDARWRTYRYFLLPAAVCLPWQLKYCLRLKKMPDMQKISGMAACFIGEHDFSAFAVLGTEQKTTVRKIVSSGFFLDREYLVFEIKGNAFLWRMVRTILGTVLEHESAGKGAEEIRRILASGDRRNAGTTAPPEGLFLYKVEYDI